MMSHGRRGRYLVLAAWTTLRGCFRVLSPGGAFVTAIAASRRATDRCTRTGQRGSRGGVKGTSSARLRFLTYLSVCSVTGYYLDVLRVIARWYPYPYFFRASA